MLVTFQSNAYADITMFGDVARTLIRLMGHSGTIPGALAADEVPEALGRLRRAVEAGGPAPAGAPRPKRNGDEEEFVSLAQRAFPLMALLEASAQEECGVLWEQR